MQLQMSGGQMLAVVLTGMLVVFFVIILLIVIISIMGKIFTNMNNSKKKEVPQTTSKPVPTPTAKVVPKSAPVVQTDDDEIIAVIASAVAMMGLADGKTYKVKSVKAVKGTTSGRTAWSMAGLRENTRPFRQR